MPYIKQADRNTLDPAVDVLTKAIQAVGVHPGNLNYVLTKLCLGYMSSMSIAPCYFQFNEVLGVLECVKLELYRRAAAPYEDEKIAENGDVYP